MQSPTTRSHTISIRELARTLEIEPPPGPDVQITGVATIDDAGPTEITFLSNDRYIERLRSSKAAAVLVSRKFDAQVSIPLLRTERPRLAFARLIDAFYPERPRATGIHPSAVVPESCTLGEDVAIGAYAVLGENVRLGDRCVLHAHAVVYDDVTIGDGCEIHSHASVREGCRLGDRIVVHNGAVIGDDGFGFEPDERGVLQKVRQIGIVDLQDDVEIQANACVDRSNLGATVIGRGTKIDNLVQVGHGCTVGEDTVLCGQVGLAGSTQVGDNAMVGGQVGSSGHLRIGDRTQVAAQSGVITDLEDGHAYGGTPAVPLKAALRIVWARAKLPETMKRVKRTERVIGEIETRLSALEAAGRG